ncbi:MAG: transposase [Armatimonadetes bacterium]|nr:transposase [Armatimonadota bacterium]
MDKSLLDLYADYLISSFGPTTATGLSGLLGGGLSHDKITRFLAGQDFTSASLWRVVKPLVRKVQSEDAVLVIDDSILHKPHTDEGELIAWHYDHSLDRSVKGLGFLSTLYCAQGVCLPVAFALVEKDEPFTDEKTGKPKRRATVSKNEHYRSMLRACVRNGLPFRYVLNDVWFSAADNMKLIKVELDKDFVMPLKGNRNVALSGQDKKDGRYQAVETLTLEHGKAQRVWLEQVPFALLLVRQVFTNKDGSQGLLYLVTSDTALGGGQITGLYQERWQVEEYHKSLKQNASLACSPTRTQRTQGNHVFLSLCAFVKLETLKLKTTCGHFALKSKLYVAALRAAFDQLQRLQPSNLLGSTSA